LSDRTASCSGVRSHHCGRSHISLFCGPIAVRSVLSDRTLAALWSDRTAICSVRSQWWSRMLFCGPIAQLLSDHTGTVAAVVRAHCHHPH
jgi:hypothetical protein